MASDSSARRGSRSGQAMAEFAIAVLSIVLVVMALVELVPVLRDNIDLLKDVREEAGRDALSRESGTASADRREEFEVEIPLPGAQRGGESELTFSGDLTERLHMPAANLASTGYFAPPNITGLQNPLISQSRNGVVLSGLIYASPEEAVSRARSALGAMPSPIATRDAFVATLDGGQAVAAACATEVVDENGVPCASLTVVIHSAGGEM